VPYPYAGDRRRRDRLKASIVDESGRLLTDRARIDTPRRRAAQEIVQALVQLVQPLGAYDRVSVGFPASCVTAAS